MPKELNEFLPGILLFLVTFLSGLLAYLIQYRFNQAIKLFLAFSGAFLLATCVMHLLPELFEEGNKYAPFILIGFLLQILIEYFSQGIEHGHIHSPGHASSFPVLIFSGLSIHAFTEGLPLSEINWNSIGSNPLYWSILLHKMPIAVILVSLFSAHGVKGPLAISSLILFSLLAPIGGIAGHFFSSSHGPEMVNYFLAASTGIFLHISTVIIFETSSNHRFNYLKFFFILAGGVFSVMIF